jgi:hypothetical protein
MTLDSTSDVMTKLWAVRPRCLGSIPDKGEGSFSSPKLPEGLWCPTSLIFKHYRGGAPSPEQGRHIVKLTTRLNRPKIRMYGAVSPLFHISPWQSACISIGAAIHFLTLIFGLHLPIANSWR